MQSIKMLIAVSTVSLKYRETLLYQDFLSYLVTVSLGGTLVAYILRANGVRAVLVSADSDSAQC